MRLTGVRSLVYVLTEFVQLSMQHVVVPFIVVLGHLEACNQIGSVFRMVHL